MRVSQDNAYTTGTHKYANANCVLRASMCVYMCIFYFQNEHIFASVHVRERGRERETEGEGENKRARARASEGGRVSPLGRILRPLTLSVQV